jgi:hypothetical protein
MATIVVHNIFIFQQHTASAAASTTTDADADADATAATNNLSLLHYQHSTLYNLPHTYNTDTTTNLHCSNPLQQILFPTKSASSHQDEILYPLQCSSREVSHFERRQTLHPMFEVPFSVCFYVVFITTTITITITSPPCSHMDSSISCPNHLVWAC